MLHSDSIPAKLSSVETFVRVLGGTTEDLRRWATAWRRIATNVPCQATSDDGTAEPTTPRVADADSRHSGDDLYGSGPGPGGGK
jgi:hypothetical protein